MPDEIQLTEEEDHDLNAACDKAGAPLIEQMKARHKKRLEEEAKAKDNPSPTVMENRSCVQDLTPSEIEELRADLKFSLEEGGKYMRELEAEAKTKKTEK